MDIIRAAPKAKRMPDVYLREVSQVSYELSKTGIESCRECYEQKDRIVERGHTNGTKL
ncbi:hypothetical protein CE91St64_44120 [Faecalicatena contorta]|nr:hypothetical protein CE91St64_44120 [Faecalicatena contorta]